jgi:hypothetical protein
MGSNVGARLPAPTAKDFDDAALAVIKAHREHLARQAVFASEMAWAVKFWRQPVVTAKWNDAPLALHASLRRTLEIIDAILSESPDAKKPVG